MQLKPEIKTSLEKMNFISRYIELFGNYTFSSNERFKTYDQDKVMAIFSELGYRACFNNNENFFKVVEKHEAFKFQVNVSMTAGHTEIIWAVWKNSELQVGLPWIMLKVLMDNADQSIKFPIFRDYADLKMILQESLLMYEDFKQELILNETRKLNDEP